LPPPPRPPASDAAAALAAVAPLANRWIERLLASGDPPLTPSQYLVLRAIAREPLSSSQIAERAGVSGPAVSQLLAALADAGLVERRLAPEDRRRHALVVSAAGERVLRAAEDRLRERLAALLDPLPAPEARALARALPHVEALLSGSAPPRRPPPPAPPPPGGPHPPERPRPRR
jgi:DNA-binding MarR family transcriptional regulator